jgi:hypothetical protein
MHERRCPHLTTKLKFRLIIYIPNRLLVELNEMPAEQFIIVLLQLP